MADDIEYLSKYKPNQLYTHPGRAGAYATIVAEGESVVGEFEVTSRCRIAVSAFWVKEKGDFGTLKITKLAYNRRYGWKEDGHIQVNHFELAHIKEFLALISNLNLADAKKARLSLANLNLGALGAILSSSRGEELVRSLAAAPELHQDIYAVARKRTELETFRKMLDSNSSEAEWQTYFEKNPWIFGHGLNYVSLDKVAKKLEANTSGAQFDSGGKRVDALTRTRAEVSQYVLVEIKRHSTDLLKKKAYRKGCWGISDEVSDAVTQIQKTAFEFGKKRFRDNLKDENGSDTSQIVYSVEPRSFLVVGNTAEILGNDDKITCFELFRRNIHSPEILTFDELYFRAKFIVENISRAEDVEPQTAD